MALSSGLKVVGAMVSSPRRTDGSGDVFVHYFDILSDGYHTLQEGDRLQKVSQKKRPHEKRGLFTKDCPSGFYQF
jgi:cold shock CspA family protein